MILGAFDPGRITSYAIFDTTQPWGVEIGTLKLVGVGRDVRPCGLHAAEVTRGIDQALVEKVGAMPKQGVSSTFTFGMSLGVVLGAMAAMGTPLDRVDPSEWKSGSRLNGLKDIEAKKAALNYAKELWPQHAAIFNVVGNHGMAEAALMARWFFLKGPGRDVPLAAGSPMKRAA